MHAMSAQTVLDSVLKYRHGVLIGNFVQDQFGIDLAKQGPNPDAKKLTTTKDHHDLSHTLYKTNEAIASMGLVNKTFYQTAKQKSIPDHLRPQKLSTYSIFHQPQAPSILSGLQNNSKKEQHLNRNGQLYSNTRYLLSNKIGCKQNQSIKVLQEQIPDILTGEIAKPRKQIVVKNQNQNRHLATHIDSSLTPKSINPYGTYSIIKPEIKKLQEVQYKNLVFPHEKGEQRDILFGHGLTLDDFQRKQLATSYDLSYNQKIKPQTQVNSFYEPGPSKTTQHFNRQLIYEKNHQQNIPNYGTEQVLHDPKVPRPYQPYTCSYDLNHKKHEYLRK